MHAQPNLSCHLQGTFGASQAAAQQQQVPYGANLGYAHPSQYNSYAPYAMNSGYGGGFQQPAANYSGYGVSGPCLLTGKLCHGTWICTDLLGVRHIASSAPPGRNNKCSLVLWMAPFQGAYGGSQGGQGATSGFAGGYGQGQSSKYQGGGGYSQGGLYSAPQRGGRGDALHCSTWKCYNAPGTW